MIIYELGTCRGSSRFLRLAFWPIYSDFQEVF
jgi:hypothetical protein